MELENEKKERIKSSTPSQNIITGTHKRLIHKKRKEDEDDDDDNEEEEVRKAKPTEENLSHHTLDAYSR